MKVLKTIKKQGIKWEVLHNADNFFIIPYFQDNQGNWVKQVKYKTCFVGCFGYAISVVMRSKLFQKDKREYVNYCA